MDTHLQLCGQANLGASDEVMEEVFKHVMNCFKILTTSACVFQEWETQRENIPSHRRYPIFSFTKRVITSRAQRKRETSLLVDIWKTNVIEYIFSHVVSPRKMQNNGTVLRADRKEDASLLEWSVSTRKARITLRQTVAGQ